MADFTEEDKVERQGGKFFDEGIHEVKVGQVVFDKMDDGREYAEFTVFDPEDNDRTASTRFWFHTSGARSYAFGQIRNMFVHNAPEADKEKVREKFNKIKNTAELEAAIEKVLVGQAAQVWLQVYQDGTYKKDGEDKPSYNRDIFGYKPQPKQTPADKAAGTMDGITVVDDDGNDKVISDF